MPFIEALYSLGIWLYGVGVKLAALRGNEKAQLWLAGRKDWERTVRGQLDVDERRRIWVHCASLGEFELAAVVIDWLKEFLPDRAIVVSFYSPSGYERRKNTSHADYVYYLPLDTPRNARRWVATVNAEAVIMVKYEWWYHLWMAMGKAAVPVYVIGGRVTGREPWNHSLGKVLFKRILPLIRHAFVVNEESAHAFASLGVAATAVGDPRADRTSAIAIQKFPLPDGLEAWGERAPTIVAGSVWPEQLPLLKAALPLGFQLLIAPHEPKEPVLALMESELIETYPTRLSSGEFDKARVILVDNVGMLSYLYRLGHFGFVGCHNGGLHNIFEAVSNCVPVIMPPHDKARHPEGQELVAAGGGFIVKDVDEMEALLANFSGQRGSRLHDEAGEKGIKWIDSHLGASKRIAEGIVQDLQTLSR